MKNIYLRTGYSHVLSGSKSTSNNEMSHGYLNHLRNIAYLPYS
jgi:hypothetical protein